MASRLVKRALIVVVLIFICKALIGAGALYWFIVRPFYLAEYGPEATQGVIPAAHSKQIIIDPVIMQDIGLQLSTVRRGAVKRQIRASASVDYDQSRLWDIALHLPAFVEKVEVPSSGVFLAEGAPLATLSLLQHDATKYVLRAPHSGWVIEKHMVAGQYVEKGATLFCMADLASLWVNIEIYEQDLPYLAIGQPVEVTFPSTATPIVRGKISFIDLLIKETTRTATARFVYDNHNMALFPGAYGVAEMGVTVAKDALLIPQEAVLRSGLHNTVFVSTSKGHFEPREVTLGSSSEHGMIEVRAGVQEGEKVVTSAQFLLDSGSSIREAFCKMTGRARA